MSIKEVSLVFSLATILTGIMAIYVYFRLKK